MILPSVDWTEIRQQIQEADIIVSLVSTAFLEPYRWQQRAFAKYQVIEPGGKPVTKSGNYNHAFYEVDLALSELCEQLRKRP